MRKENSAEIPAHLNLSKCLTFSAANQIVGNKHNDEELEFLLRSSCYMWATSRENVSSGIFEWVGFKSACSATEAS